MTYAEARVRLANHAGLAGEQLPAEESVSWVLFIATRSNTAPDLRPHVADIIACLEIVNHELNGPVPSETFERVREQAIVEVVYSVSGIISKSLAHHRQWVRQSLFAPENRDALEDAIYRIAYAWDQVLAGDIDDILEGIDCE